MDENRAGLACLFEATSEQASERAALLGCDQPPLSYRSLKTLIEITHRKLLAAGLRRGDRVALAISNGPEAATAFLSVAAGHICAPLNPTYRAAEFEFYLSDLKPKALIVEAGLETAAGAVAAKLGIPVFYLRPARDRAAGAFDLDTAASPQHDPDAHPHFAGAYEVALVLHTSGTTSRPKLVPLTHANLLENARNISSSLRLSPSDCCLNVMPLFHVHGLIGALLSSLAAGASVFCSPGFQAARFFSWLDDSSATWYTAVPTMHQAILARAAQSRDIIARSHLRFVRSCSSALPPQVMAGLEEVFRIPTVEAYGMTEASHQIACNPLPPGLRKPGSVGIATGPEVAIIGSAGDLLPPGATGEIAIRGSNVTHGYDNNSEANASAFLGGWFRTGDQGYIDSAGYVFINGRTKEMINRGGEKIAPREIDEALMDHPAVQQAVAFALPDPRLGEDVGAVVVLREGASADEAELQQFVGTRLADFKVPRKIVFAAEIPKGPTGKLQRIGLAAKLQITPYAVVRPRKEFTAPRNKVEEQLAGFWRQILGLDKVSVHDGFFDLGGDSSGATQLLACIHRSLGKKLEMSSLLDAPTIADLEAMLRQAPRPRPRVSAIQSGGNGTPFFFVHASPLVWQLARHAAVGRPFLTLIPPAVEDLPLPLTLENVATYHVKSMRDVQPAGPYYLGGWCMDGIVALEIARQLRLSGEQVGGVLMFDSRNPLVTGLAASHGGRPSPWNRLRYHWAHIRQLPRQEQADYLAERASTIAVYLKRRLWRLAYRLNLLTDRRVSAVVRDMEQVLALAVTHYVPARYDGTVILMRPVDRARSFDEDEACGWRSLLPNLVVHEVPGNHRTLFLSPNVEIVASILCEMLCEKIDGEMHHVEHHALSAQPPKAATTVR